MTNKWNKTLQEQFLKRYPSNATYKNSKYPKRAIVQFLPPLEKYVKEFKAFFYNSWLYTCAHRNIPGENQPIKTDLLIFTPEKNFKFMPKNFTEIIVSPSGKYRYKTGYESPISSCYYIKTEEVDQKEWNYVFTDNLFYLGKKSNYPLLLSYDFILKTESDSFLTKNFSNWLPNIFVVGNGRYAKEQKVKEKIKSIAEKSNKILYNKCKDKWVHNVGASLYGDPYFLIHAHLMALEVLNYILHSEFIDYEGKWPGWYRGVSSMYAIEIGVNFALANGEFKRNTLALDHFSTEGKVSETAHIHCFHTFNLFSKFEFSNGQYDRYNRIKITNTDLIPYYCLMISLGKFDRSKVIENPADYAALVFAKKE